jgi:hypothetical protein
MMNLHAKFVSTVSSLLTVGLLFVVGCGNDDGEVDPGDDDDNEVTDTGGMDVEPEPDTAPDTAPDTMADAGMADTDEMEDVAQDTGQDTMQDAGPEESAVFVAVTTDFMGESPQSNAYAAGAFPSGEVDSIDTNQQFEYAPMHLDTSGDHVYLLDRRCARGGGDGCPIDNGTVQEFDVSEPTSATTTDSYNLQFETGGMTVDQYNPHGVGRVDSSGNLFVSSYNATTLFEYDAPGATSASWPLADFQDQEGSLLGPSAVFVDGDHVAITLERFAASSSRLAVFDSADGSFVDYDSSADGVQALELQSKNVTVGPRQGPEGNWTFGSTGEYTDDNGELILDGSITRLERSAAGEYSVGETIIDEETLGGNLSDYVMTGPNTGLAIVADASFTNRVIQFSASGGDVSTNELKALNVTRGTAMCLSPDGSTVMVGNSEDTPQFHAYDTSNWEERDYSPLEVEGAATPTGCEFVSP